MHKILVQKLSQYSELLPEDIQALKYVCNGKPRIIKARQSILRQGEALRFIPFILGGWVGASKHLEDGRWQMLSLFVTGDICDYGLASLEEMDHALRTITDTIVLDLASDELEELSFANPRIGKALRWSSLVQSANAQEWVVSLGQRSAKERCAHLICELFWRLRAAKVTRGNTFDFPLTQEEVGAAIGVSTVHANRVLQDLRIAKLIEQNGRFISILDQRGLENLALFNPKYLHLAKTEQRSEAFDALARYAPAQDVYGELCLS